MVVSPARPMAAGSVVTTVHRGGFEALELEMPAGAVVWAEPGAFVSGSGDLDFAVTAAGSVRAMIGRLLSGERLMRQRIMARGPSRVVLAGEGPGGVLEIPMRTGDVLRATRGALLATLGSVQPRLFLDRHFARGVFTGMGWAQQELRGEGTAFLHAIGAILRYDLRPGETMAVQPDSIVAYDASARLDLRLWSNVVAGMFGGEGWFFCQVTGPGRVWVQSLSAHRALRQLRRTRRTSAHSSRTQIEEGTR
ncbi:MAG: hypothetical protein C0497_05880 [Gemmatimonas sp.]|nr:hypothetical protein [Gemmatimonas sp.]